MNGVECLEMHHLRTSTHPLIHPQLPVNVLHERAQGLASQWCEAVQLVLWSANVGDLGPFDTQTGHQSLLIENEGIGILLQA